MQGHAAGLRQSDRLIWSLIVVVAAVVALAVATSRFSLAASSFIGPGSAIVLFLVGQYVYSRCWPDERLAAALGGTAQLAAFAAVGAPLSYIGASLDLPLRDRWFDAADRALGLDWTAWFASLNAHAELHTALWLLYFSLLPQTAVVVLVLAFRGHLAWLRVYMLGFIITTLVAIAIAAILPSAGAWAFYKLSASNLHVVPAVHGDYLPAFYGLRDGTARLLVATGAKGIITFPSVHAALGVLLIAALWPVPVLRWVSLAINAAMVLAVPVEGGHYFVDVFAGLAIAAVSLLAARAIVQRAHAVPPADIEAALVPSR